MWCRVCTISDSGMTENVCVSLAVKFSQSERMSPWLLIGREWDLLTGVFAVKLSEPLRMSPS